MNMEKCLVKVWQSNCSNKDFPTLHEIIDEIVHVKKNGFPEVASLEMSLHLDRLNSYMRPVSIFMFTVASNLLYFEKILFAREKKNVQRNLYFDMKIKSINELLVNVYSNLLNVYIDNII